MPTELCSHRPDGLIHAVVGSMRVQNKLFELRKKNSSLLKFVRKNTSFEILKCHYMKPDMIIKIPRNTNLCNQYVKTQLYNHFPFVRTRNTPSSNNYYHSSAKSNSPTDYTKYEHNVHYRFGCWALCVPNLNSLLAAPFPSKRSDPLGIGPRLQSRKCCRVLRKICLLIV